MKSWVSLNLAVLLELLSCRAICYYDPQLVSNYWHVEVPALSDVGPWAISQWLKFYCYVYTDTSRLKLALQK